MNLKIDDRIIATQYGVKKHGTVTRLGRSVVFVRFDDSPRERWLHRDSIEPLMPSTFERFELELTLDDARSASHQGNCDEDVKALSDVPYIRAQLDALDPAKVRAELREYGAWDADELADEEQNLQRILWLAAGNIREEAGV